MHLDVTSIGYVCLCMCMYVLISEFESWITYACSSHVVCWCDFSYNGIGEELAIAMHLTLLYGVLVCHQYDVCENYVGCVYDGGYCGLSES